MDELLIKSKDLVNNNLKDTVDSHTLELMQYAVCGLLLTIPEVTIERLPKILNELDIYAKDKSVLDIAHEDLENYSEDDLLKYSDACVTRSLFIDDETKEITEKRSLLVSLKFGCSDFQRIFKINHELIHLLRFFGIVQSDEKLRIRDGISVSNYNINTNELKRRNYFFEEGIVQTFNNKAMRNLAEYLIDEKINTSISHNFLGEIKDYKFNDYIIATGIINSLCKDSNFTKLLDESFYDMENPSMISQYFNNKVGSTTAFTKLNKLLDLTGSEFFRDEKDLDKVKDAIISMNDLVFSFLRGRKVK